MAQQSSQKAPHDQLDVAALQAQVDALKAATAKTAEEVVGLKTETARAVDTLHRGVLELRKKVRPLPTLAIALKSTP